MDIEGPDQHTPEVKCFVCGGTFSFMLAQRDILYHMSERYYAVYRCAGCGLLKILPEPTADEIAGFYPEDYYSFRIEENTSGIARAREALKDEALRFYYGIPGGSKSRRLLARCMSGYMSKEAISGVPLHPPRHNGRFLDIGCGDGYWVHKLGTYGWDCTGVEFVGEESDRIRVGDFMDMGFDSGFEFIRLNHVLEHVLDPDAYLARIRSLLCEGGELYLAVPNADGISFRVFGRYWSDLDAPRHLHGFNMKSLAILLARNGLKARSVRFTSRYSFGNGLKNLVNEKIGITIKDEQLLMSLVLSPLDVLMNLIGPGNLINVEAILLD